MALCGACTVHLDGQAIRSCVTPIAAAVGKKISTIEHMQNDKVGQAVQAAWSAVDVVQCGTVNPARLWQQQHCSLAIKNLQMKILTPR
jgi:aerobic-type carbon monoxide dehydrogenase small subunit (CoxS/CutS family)